jgi:hypothetical protein
MKLKLVIAAAVMAAIALPAAAVTTPATNLELLFVAYDVNSSGKDYVRDLGALATTIGASNVSFGAGTTFGTAVGQAFASVTSSNIYWNVIAVDAANSTAYTTGNLTKLNAAGNGSFEMDTNVGTGGIVPNNLALLATNFSKGNSEYYGATAGSGQNALDLVGALIGNSSKVVSGHGLNTSQNFFTMDGNGTASQIRANAGLLAFDGNAKGGYFTLDNTGALSYTGTAAPSAVPLPAAAMLFGPGLLGLFGFARKRKAA